MFLGDMTDSRPGTLYVQDDSKIFYSTRKEVLKNDGDIKQRHKNQLKGELTGELWDHLNIKIIMHLKEIYIYIYTHTIEKI